MGIVPDQKKLEIQPNWVEHAVLDLTLCSKEHYWNNSEYGNS